MCKEETRGILRQGVDNKDKWEPYDFNKLKHGDVWKFEGDSAIYKCIGDVYYSTELKHKVVNVAEVIR